MLETTGCAAVVGIENESYFYSINGSWWNTWVILLTIATQTFPVKR